MTITVKQLSFTGGEWAQSLYSRTDLEKYSTAVREMTNFFVHPHGGASNRGGSQFVVEVKDSTKFTRLIPFQFSVTQAYVLEFGNLYMRVIRDGGQVVTGGTTPVEIVTPYLEADLPKVKFIQSADVLYVTHPSYAPRKISRTSHTTWTISTITFGSTVAAPTALAGTGVAPTDPLYVVTAIDSEGRESVASASKNIADGNILTWSGSGAYFNIYKDESVSGVYGWVGKSNSATFTIPAGGIEPDFSKSPPEAITRFNSTDNYPGVCTFFEQRLVFARTNNQPQTIWGSVVGDFENMNVSAFTKDDDAYEFTINARQVNEIRSLVPVDILMLGTSGAEWKMEAGGSSDAVTPLSVNLKMQSQYGTSDVAPLVVGSSILFIEGSGSVVRDLTYNYEINGYKGNSLVIFSPHLFDGYTLTDWAFQQDPDSIIWAVRDDGDIVALTFYREQNVYGWHRHETDGSYESIASISTTEGTDEVYTIVKRNINGADVRYIERFLPRIPYDDDFVRDIEDAYFVDCGLTYDGTASTTISGLDHLEAKEVAVLADGNVVNGLTVTSGAITLPQAASKIHIGLPYESKIETLDFIAQGQDGTTQDKISDVKSIVVSLANTRALWYGPSDDRLVEVPFREDEDYGAPTEMFSGNKELFLESGETRESRAVFKNVDPLPVTILGLLPRLEYGEG